MVPVPAVSETVWAPTETTLGPVEPPQRASVASVTPSMRRLNLPLSPAGTQTLFTVSVGRRGVVVVQVLTAAAGGGVPPQRASVASVTPSMRRLNLPLSPAGTQTLFTVSVGRRVLVIVQVLT